ncbi:IS630 family transposase [Persicimonas caeni]|uniref:IS630 family transposase n=1 Tax=Persicimonas caeni TaxID=2292766 RepID=A0A4Y6PM72_PERCE|nr:IS630 family transposase [Persicimonas caeni]QED30571.1 IS630 family transposase [Persicimonas caeni]
MEATRENLGDDEVLYYADEFNISWLPTLRAMWSPVGQQVMIPTPGITTRRYGLGAVNWQTGDCIVLVRRRKRRIEACELLEALLTKHPDKTVYVVWDNAAMHSKKEIDHVVDQSNGRLKLLYLPTYSPWLNPIEMLWRHWRREVTHCELFETIDALVDATNDFFDRCNRLRHKVLSIIGSKHQDFRVCT